MIFINSYNFKLCSLGIAEDDGAVCNVFFSHEAIPGSYLKKETPFIKKAARQFEEYFSGKRKKFDLPLALRGTEFQLKVWNLLQEIPYGETRSYGHLAKLLKNPNASRAVGMANNRNRIPVIVPCHRVIGHNGNLTGYAGGLDLKKSLLELEKAM